jgi:DNA-binding transcriptional ArsR family regulator
MWTTPNDPPGLGAVEAADLARRARAVSDPRRVQILGRLVGSPATVGELAAVLGLRPAQTSLQLAVLREVGFVRLEPRGRHRIYSVDGDAIQRLFEELGSAPENRFRRPKRPSGGPVPGSPLQIARTCYDHLAGARAVELATEMERLRWLVRSASGFVVTRRGEVELLRRGVSVPLCREARRKFAPGCLDSSERRWHIGGSIGHELLRGLERGGFARRGPGRVVRLGRPILEWLAPGPA